MTHPLTKLTREYKEKQIKKLWEATPSIFAVHSRGKMGLGAATFFAPREMRRSQRVQLSSESRKQICMFRVTIARRRASRIANCATWQWLAASYVTSTVTPK